jgi:hypothetical protein
MTVAWQASHSSVVSSLQHLAEPACLPCRELEDGEREKQEESTGEKS